jgi:hypothetical protein
MIAPKTNTFRLIWLVSMLALTGATSAAPQIGYAYPAGGRQGTTFRVEIGGQSLSNVDGVRVSGEGVQASVVEYVWAMDNQELRDTERFLRNLVMRRWVSRVKDEAMKKTDEPPLPDHPWLRGLDEMSPNRLNEIRTRLFDPKKQPNAQLAEKVVLEVTVGANATPGDRELRLIGPSGLSNPLCFQVGKLPEACEQEFAGGAAGRVMEPPILLNGQIMPGEVDHIRIRAKKGQKLVFRLHARRLIPYLADAVPGWFQAIMSLRSPDGKEVAWSDDYRFDPDPALLYEVPADGVYELVVRDSIYRGRDDFVYRIAVGELPFVTQVFPLGGQAGSQTKTTVSGWNLTPTSIPLDTSADGPPVRRTTVGLSRGFVSEVRYVVDDWPSVTEVEPNQSVEQAQAIAFPQAVNGRIGQPGDIDRFRFTGRKGQKIVAEVWARRLNSPLDSALRLTDAKGKEIALSDDYKDREIGLLTHQADSMIEAELPHDGEYVLTLSDTQRQGGEAFAYRLRLRPSQPDFALRLVPSALNLSSWQSASCEVHVLRKEGFKGAVDLAIADAPEGFKLSGATIPADKDKIEVRLTAPRGLPRQVVAIRLEGRAKIGDKEVRRPAVPAEDMMQAFLWRFLVPREELLVSVGGAKPVPAIWRPILPGTELVEATPVKIPLGGTATVRVKAPQIIPDSGGIHLSALDFQIANRPRGVTLRDAKTDANGILLTLAADRNIALPGDIANVLVEASGTGPGKMGTSTEGLRSRVALGVLPAIEFEVVNE